MLEILTVQGRSVVIEMLGICEDVARLNLIYRDVTTDGNVINTPVPLESTDQSIYIVELPLQEFEKGKTFSIQVMINPTGSGIYSPKLSDEACHNL